MNVFDKALKSFNKRAVLQKALVGKPQISWTNWDFVSRPGIPLLSKPDLPEDCFKLGSGLDHFFSGIDSELKMDVEEMNPILKLRESDEITFGRHGIRRRMLHGVLPFASRRVISESSVDSGEVGIILPSIDRDQYLVPNYDNFIIRPALKLSYADAFKLLRFQIIDRLNKNGQQYLVELIKPMSPNLHSLIVRKMIGRIIQDLLTEGADHLAPYFAEKFGAAF